MKLLSDAQVQRFLRDGYPTLQAIVSISTRSSHKSTIYFAKPIR